MPALRARVGELFGGRIAEGVDPMTIVARGAALYAGSIGLDATPAARAPEVAAGVARAHRASARDRRRGTVRRRALPAGGGRGAARARARHARRTAAGRSGDAALSAEGSFVVQVALARHRKQRLPRARVRPRRRRRRVATPAFAIVHGVSVADPPLARAIGVARADDLTQVYFAKGTPLPARRTFVHHTVRAIVGGQRRRRAGDPGRAGRVGAGAPQPADRDVAPGRRQLAICPPARRVEVTLELDRSGQLHTRADVPGDRADVRASWRTCWCRRRRSTTAERELAATSRRAADVQRRTFQLGVPAAVQAIGDVSALLAEAERALPPARDGDLDAAQKLHRLLIDANLRAGRGRGAAGVAGPRRRGAALQPVLHAAGRAVGDARRAAALRRRSWRRRRRARRRSDAAELELHLEAMRSIGRAAYCRDPRAMADAHRRGRRRT